MPVVDSNKNLPVDERMERLEYSKKYRVKNELSWFATQMFIEQNAFYVQTNGELKEKRPQKGYRTIAKARKMIRSIKNALTKESPRWMAKSFMLEDDHTDEDRYIASKFLESVYRKNSVGELVKDVVHNALMKANGYWQIYWDGKDIAIQEIDSWDAYLDPHGRWKGPKFQGRWIVKSIPIPVDIANKKRPQKVPFTADNQLAESPHKITIRNNDEAKQISSRFGTIMAREFYIKDTPDIKIGASEGQFDVVAPGETPKTPYTPDNNNAEIPQEQVKVTREKIRRVLYIQGKVIEDERTDMEEFPIICYQPERFAGKVYPTPWMDPIIELNKSLNRIYTSLEDWVYTFSKGRYLAKRNENISNISDQNGQIVYYDNVPPSYMQQGSPGSVPFQVLGLSEQYADDAGGIHAESTGSTSGANIRSSSQIMQMQAGDIQNMAEPLDNLKSFLSVAGEMILDIASRNMSAKQKLRIGDKTETIQGSQASATIDKLTVNKNESTDPVRKIMPFTNLGVDIIPGTAYTDIQARQDLITLREIGVAIPDEILLDTFKVGDTQEILLKMKLEEAKHSNPDVDMATAENKKMLMGQEVMANMTDDHRVHKMIHAKFLQANQANTQLAQMIIAHIKQHEAFEKPAPQVNPMEQVAPTEPAPEMMQ